MSNLWTRSLRRLGLEAWRPRIRRRFGAQNVVAGDRIKGDNSTALFDSKFVSRRAIGKRNGFSCTHSASQSAADYKKGRVGVYPIVWARVLPAWRPRHIGDVNRTDVLRLLGQKREGDRVAP